MNRKRLIYVALAMSAVTVCVAIFLHGGGLSEMTKTLPDGSVLALRRITKGTKHRYVSGNLFQRTTGRVIPEPWAKKLGAGVVNFNSSNDTHVIWLERNWSTNLLRSSGFASTFTLRITTDAGFDRLYVPVAGLVTPASEVRGFRFDALLPTASRNLRVTAGRNPFDPASCASLDVPNPEFVARRRWPARPCPASVEQDEVSLDLERFATGVQHLTSAMGLHSTALSFVIRDRAVPTNNWFARSVRLFNEAGSEFLPPFLPTEASLARTGASFPFGVSSAEPYKLRFELRRTSYGPDDQHVFRVVPVPKATEPTSQPPPAQLQGFTLVLALTANGGVTARIEPPKNDWRLDLVRVVDDRGRWLPARGGSSNDGRFSGSLALEADSATVDVTFGLTRLRTLELIAQPSRGP